jgi:hypothetical protein
VDRVAELEKNVANLKRLLDVASESESALAAEVSAERTTSERLETELRSAREVVFHYKFGGCGTVEEAKRWDCGTRAIITYCRQGIRG